MGTARTNWLLLPGCYQYLPIPYLERQVSGGPTRCTPQLFPVCMPDSAAGRGAVARGGGTERKPQNVVSRAAMAETTHVGHAVRPKPGTYVPRTFVALRLYRSGSSGTRPNPPWAKHVWPPDRLDDANRELVTARLPCAKAWLCNQPAFRLQAEKTIPAPYAFGCGLRWGDPNRYRVRVHVLLRVHAWRVRRRATSDAQMTTRPERVRHLPTATQ